MTSRALRLAAVTPGEERGYNRAAMNDAALVRAVLEGHQTAFATLVDRHAPVCLRYATRMLGSREDAEDVTQETFVRAHGALARYDGSVAFQTWLMSILINRCRTALSARRKRDARITSDNGSVALAAVPAEADDAALRDAIARALERLDAQQREAFLLKHVEQLSYEEMSRMTGVGISALKMRVRRACEHLKTLLEGDRNG
jgi:RNA polymerase sigma-70 factor (ECF subfamily)